MEETKDIKSLFENDPLKYWKNAYKILDKKEFYLCISYKPKSYIFIDTMYLKGIDLFKYLLGVLQEHPGNKLVIETLEFTFKNYDKWDFIYGITGCKGFNGCIGLSGITDDPREKEFLKGDSNDIVSNILQVLEMIGCDTKKFKINN